MVLNRLEAVYVVLFGAIALVDDVADTRRPVPPILSSASSSDFPSCELKYGLRATRATGSRANRDDIFAIFMMFCDVRSSESCNARALVANTRAGLLDAALLCGAKY